MKTTLFFDSSYGKTLIQCMENISHVDMENFVLLFHAQKTSRSLQICQKSNQLCSIIVKFPKMKIPKYLETKDQDELNFFRAALFKMWGTR